MEIIRILFLSIIIILFLHSYAIAQDHLIDAFRESYTAENEGNYSQAIEYLEQIYDPASYEVNLRVGWLSYLKGDMEDSINYYQRAVDLKPYAIEPKIGLAYPYSFMGMWNEIISLYESILRIDPQNSLINYRLGLVYYNRGQHERADPYIEKVVNLYPFDYDSLLLFGWNKLMLQRTREAKILFQKVLLISPDNESALNGLSLLQ